MIQAVVKHDDTIFGAYHVLSASSRKSVLMTLRGHSCQRLQEERDCGGLLAGVDVVLTLQCNMLPSPVPFA